MEPTWKSPCRQARCGETTLRPPGERPTLFSVVFLRPVPPPSMCPSFLLKPSTMQRGAQRDRECPRRRPDTAEDGPEASAAPVEPTLVVAPSTYCVASHQEAIQFPCRMVAVLGLNLEDDRATAVPETECESGDESVEQSVVSHCHCSRKTATHRTAETLLLLDTLGRRMLRLTA